MICDVQLSLISILTPPSAEMELQVFGMSSTMAWQELWHELQQQGWVVLSREDGTHWNSCQFVEPWNY